MALSHQPHLPAPEEGIARDEVQIAAVSTDISEMSIPELLQADASPNPDGTDSFAEEQRKDPGVAVIIKFLEENELAQRDQDAHKVAAQALRFELIDGILYYVDTRPREQKRAVVPRQLCGQILKENHNGHMPGHFSGPRLYNTLAKRWWWQGMYSDCVSYCKKCPQCVVVGGTGRTIRPPLKPIPVQRAFQILGVDVMDLPKTEMGNYHVVVFQDFLTKWPLVFPVSDQKATTLAKLLAEEVIPVFGVPEALLSDRGTFKSCRE